MITLNEAQQEPNDSNNNRDSKAESIPLPQLTEKVAEALRPNLPRREKQWVRLGYKRSLIEEMYRRNLSPEQFAGELIKEGREAESATTLRRWARDYDADKLDGGERLLDKPRPGRPRKVCDKVLLYTFPRVLGSKKRSIRSLYGEVLKWALANGCAMPNYATFRRYVREMNEAVAKRHLDKFKDWYEKHEISVSQDDGFSNEIWVTDASELKITVIDGKDLFRPQIVIFMDKSSRLIMGWMLTKHAVTTDDVVVCLKHGMLPKNIHGVEWFGKPRCIHSDNGTPFVSGVLRANLARLGVGFTNSPVASPENNGRMERLFRTLGEGWLSAYETKICGRFVNGEGRAQALWNTLPGELDEAIMDYNFGRVHSALGVTPYQAWENGLRDLSLVQVDCKAIDESIYVERVFTVGKLGVQITPGEFWFCAGFAGLRSKSVTVQMRPEGPSKGMMARIGDRFLGELVMQGDGASVAKALKKAQADQGKDIQGLMRTVAKGYVRHNKSLGKIKGDKVRSTSTKSKPGTKPKGKAVKSKASKSTVFKTTKVKKGNS